MNADDLIGNILIGAGVATLISVPLAIWLGTCIRKAREATDVADAAAQEWADPYLTHLFTSEPDPTKYLTREELDVIEWEMEMRQR